MIHQSDLKIRSAISLGLDDIRKNPWLLDDILSDVVNDPYLKAQYGSQIKSAKEWFENNQIDIYMRMRNDKDRLPCITITLGNAQEQDDLKSMGDASPEVDILLPNRIGKPIPFVVKPFTPTSYDPSTGEIGIDNETKGFDKVAPGMIIVNPATGEGMTILDVGNDFVIVEENVDLQATQLAIVPQFQYYKARREHTMMRETYSIGVHAHGDPQVVLWLYSIVMYSLFRYRESLLEARGFSQSTLSASDLMENPNYTGPGGEVAYTRMITLTGITEQSWIKTPHRIIEAVVLKDGLRGGIQILSNSEPGIAEDENWFPIDENASDDEA